MTDLPPWAQVLIECERRVLGPSEEERERALIALTAVLSFADGSARADAATPFNRCLFPSTRCALSERKRAD